MADPPLPPSASPSSATSPRPNPAPSPLDLLSAVAQERHEQEEQHSHSHSLSSSSVQRLPSLSSAVHPPSRPPQRGRHTLYPRQPAPPPPPRAVHPHYPFPLPRTLDMPPPPPPLPSSAPPFPHHHDYSHHSIHDQHQHHRSLSSSSTPSTSTSHPPPPSSSSSDFSYSRPHLASTPMVRTGRYPPPPPLTLPPPPHLHLPPRLPPGQHHPLPPPSHLHSFHSIPIGSPAHSARTIDSPYHPSSLPPDAHRLQNGINGIGVLGGVAHLSYKPLPKRTGASQFAPTATGVTRGPALVETATTTAASVKAAFTSVELAAREVEAEEVEEQEKEQERGKAEQEKPKRREERPVYTTPGTKKGGKKAGKGKLEPIVSSTLWEDERTIVMQVLVDGHVVARRADNDWVNSTKLLNMAGLTRGKRDMYLKNEPERIVFRRGALHLKGVWLPLDAAARLAKSYSLFDRLYPLFEPNIRRFLFTPANRDRTTQLVRAARARETMPKPEEQKGIAEEEREERVARSKALEKLLTELEEGLEKAEKVDDAMDVDEDEEATAEGDAASAGDAGPCSPREDEPSSAVASGLVGPASATYSAYSISDDGGQPSTSATSSFPDPSSLPPSARRFSLAEHHLQQLAPHAAQDGRRPSLTPGFTREYQSSVAWYDNPTPPGNSMHEYFSAAEIARRMSVAGGSMLSSSDAETLQPLVEDEETNEWGPGGVMGRSRATFAGRRASVPVQLEAKYYSHSPIGQQCSAVRAPQHSATFPPASFSSSSSYPNDPSSFSHANNLPPSHVDYASLLADLQALSSQSADVLPHGSPLSRFNATRLSIDSAAEAVYPHVGLGAESLVAPHAHSHEIEGAGGNYSWAPAPPSATTEEPYGYAQGGYNEQQHQPSAEPREPTPYEQLEALLSGSSSASTAGGAGGTPTSALPSATYSAHGSASPFPSTSQAEEYASTGFYSFPSPALPPPPPSAAPQLHPPPLDARTSTKRVLAELDAQEAQDASAPFSSHHHADSPADPLDLPPPRHQHRPFLPLRRNSSYSPSVSAAAASTEEQQTHRRLSTPTMRRDSLIGFGELEQGQGQGQRRGTYEVEEDEDGEREEGEIVEKEAEEEELLSPRSAKRPRLALEGEDGGVLGSVEEEEREVRANGVVVAV
ncbi:hypothetical protein JCM8547_005115 [Rhodosporidiobolus lusitaniae]